VKCRKVEKYWYTSASGKSINEEIKRTEKAVEVSTGMWGEAVKI